jgi:hypothetical protein
MIIIFNSTKETSGENVATKGGRRGNEQWAIGNKQWAKTKKIINNQHSTINIQVNAGSKLEN